MSIPLPINSKIIIDYTPQDNDKWIQKTIFKDQSSVGINGIHNFQVYTLIKNNYVLMKPVEPVFTSEFERLFDFGCSCSNYDPNRIIAITSPINYFKYLI